MRETAVRSLVHPFCLAASFAASMSGLREMSGRDSLRNGCLSSSAAEGRLSTWVSRQESKKS